jgi:HAE1 family hydrophobic/amphiphilic exporter-1
MIARFFIQRPVSAIVCCILITMIGLIALFQLPRALHPDIIPPNVQISGSYTGANALTIEQTVLAPLEKAINGALGMIYLQSNATNSGTFTINATFEVGVNVNDALVEIQTRVRQAEPALPEEVRRIGLNLKKVSPSMLRYFFFHSPNNTHDINFLSNYLFFKNNCFSS